MRLPRAPHDDLVHPGDTAAFLFIVAEHAAGRRPSVREVAHVLDVNLSTAHGHLSRLRRKGLVTWAPGQQRTLRPAFRVMAHTPDQ